jgi:hypothetical protein
MRRIIVIAALAAFVALALAATLSSTRGQSKAPLNSASRSAPSHSRAFWVVHHKQP